MILADPTLDPDTQIDLGRAFDRLDPRDREVLLAELRGFARHEIAAVAGMSTARVSQLSWRARERLQAAMQRGAPKC